MTGGSELSGSTDLDALLDRAVWHAATGPHAHLARRRGRVVAYEPDVAAFGALPPDPTPGDWRDAATLVGPGGVLVLTGDVPTPPGDWGVVVDIPGVQLVADDDGPVVTAADPEAVRLGPDDVEEMTDLVRRTEPGPFLPRTVQMGTYLGVRRSGRLVAMAGERLHPAGGGRGATEISAVCTDAAWRGQGLGRRLVLAVAHGTRQRGELPFLHASASNTGAIGLYEHLGFRLRRTTRFAVLTPPQGAETPDGL
ncbi:GNAT family N-acetyltransferase [Quadrisphaera sp. INWT6]|uniref:GNAT family N-acetyltransferase n=1 Tax=Quadrisphaera sp. INWT6 TaxID=2596917 RepID=UPI0018922238|nr:GNAT family N-acetyltransferase [Quadrisphaera sp. INWT6]MBF5081245.1 GNAT family N-acetyltransferase [Quadrisphaera sp. INWT6]